MVTAEKVAERASKVLKQPITADMVNGINRVASRLRAQARARKAIDGPEYIRCVCGCGTVFPRRYAREKIAPQCRPRVYADKRLLAACKLKTPVVVPAPRGGVSHGQ